MSNRDFTLDEIMEELHRGSDSASSKSDPFMLDRVLAEVREYTASTRDQETQSPAPLIEEALSSPQEEPINQTEQAPLTEYAEESQENALDSPKALEESQQIDASQEATEALIDSTLEEEMARERLLSTRQEDYLQMKKTRAKLVRAFELQPTENPDEELEAKDKVSVEIAPEGTFDVAPAEDAAPEKSQESSAPVKEQAEPEPELEPEHNSSHSKLLENYEEEFDDRLDETFDEFTEPSQIPQIRAQLKQLMKQMRAKTIGAAVLAIIAVVVGCSSELLATPIAIFDPQTNPLILLCSSFVLVLLAGANIFDFFASGLSALLKRRINANSPYSVAYAVLLVVNVLLLAFPAHLQQAGVTLFVPLMLVCLTALPAGKYLALRRVLKNFETVANLDEPHALEFLQEDELLKEFTAGQSNGEPVLVYNRKAPFLSHFMEESFTENTSEQTALYALPITAVVALVCAVVIVARGDGFFVAASAVSLVFVLGAGVLPTLVGQMALGIAADRLSPIGAGVLGGGACEALEEGNAIYLDAKDLFKGTDVTLYGIKTFLDGPPVDRVIVDAASILNECNSILGEVFLNIVNNRKDYLSSVDDIKYEDGMGISAWVDDRRILIGSRDLMVKHAIKVPDQEYGETMAAGGRHLLYLASSGDLSAIFAIGLDCNDEIYAMMNRLYAEKVLAVVKTVDPIISEEVLGHAFHLPEEVFRVIPSSLHEETVQMSDSAEPVNGGVFNNGSLFSYVQSFLSAKAVGRSLRSGVLVYYVTTGLILLLTLMFAFLHNMSQMTNVLLCVYEGVSLAVCTLVQRLSNRV